MENNQTRGNLVKSPSTTDLQLIIEQHLEVITKLQDQLATEERALMTCLKKQKEIGSTSHDQ